MENNIKIYRASWIYRFFSSTDTSAEIVTDRFEVIIKSPFEQEKLEELNITDFEVKPDKIFFRAVVLKSGNKIVNTIAGLSKSKAQNFITKTKAIILQRKAIIDKLSKSNLNSEIGEWAYSAECGALWVAMRDLEAYSEVAKKYAEFLSLPLSIYEEAGLINELEALNSFATDGLAFRKICNRKFRKMELERYKNFFERTSEPLTNEQQEAVICNEDALLVVASAGSGKTKLLINKVDYLLDKELACPDEILLLAFNKGTKETLKERIKDITTEPIAIETFHSFGLQVIGEISGKKPTLSKFAENENDHREHIQQILTDVISDTEYFPTVRRFLAAYMKPFRDAWDFKDEGEYFAYVKGVNPITLKRDLLTLKYGERVKSLEELLIANTLFLNGVDYLYETRYEFDTATSKKTQYKPDFYLTKEKIYLEHFGINEAGDTAPYIDQNEYLASMKWKRALHSENDTICIETYSHEMSRGVLVDSLIAKLKEQGVKLTPIPREQMLELINERGYISELAKLCTTFLHLFKGKGENFLELESRVGKDTFNDVRASHFLKIFSAVYERYEKNLTDANEIDFDDMIEQACEAIENKGYRRQFKYILVDEFQDISLGRAKLLKATQKATKSEQFMAVGDDWQAINRFAGGDISVMTQFAVDGNFGHTEVYKLTKTFRFNDKINDVASKFISANPMQLPKTVQPSSFSQKNEIIIINPVIDDGSILRNIFQEISQLEDDEETTVMILGRYNYISANVDAIALRKEFPKIEFNFTTVHRAKGLEADYVIVLEMIAGSFRPGSGFPSEATDDPLFNLVLANPDSFPQAEERRLFYVALTRAKKRVYLAGGQGTRSPFIKELMDPVNKYSVEHRGSAGQPDRSCPQCVSGSLKDVQAKNSERRFLSCENFPLCDFATNYCSVCEIVFLTLSRTKYQCDNSKCSNEAPRCPSCSDGWLSQRDGRYGAFWGCSNYSTRKKCKYTR
jgi:DNA helicase IV